MTRRESRLASALALAALLVGSAACEETPESAGTAVIPAGPDTLPPPDQVVEDGEHVITVEGVKKAVLLAEQMYFYNETNTVVGDTIQVTFFDAAGDFVSELTATTGVINQRSQQMTAHGDVHVRSDDSRIATEVLHYEPDEDRIWSDQSTTIHQAGNVIRGRGVESDPALERIRITGGSAVLRSEPELGPRTEEDEQDEDDEDGERRARTDRQRAIEEAEEEARRRGAEAEAGEEEDPSGDAEPEGGDGEGGGTSDDGS